MVAAAADAVIEDVEEMATVAEAEAAAAAHEKAHCFLF